MMKCSIKIVSAHLVGRIYERVGRDRAEWTEEQELCILALLPRVTIKIQSPCAFTILNMFFPLFS